MRLVLLLVLVSGCVTTHPAPLDTDAGRADLNARTAGRVATLYTRGERHAARDLHIGPDETTWTNRLSGQPQSTPTADVTAVSLRRGGVLRSFLIGAGIGTALGLFAWTQDDGGILSYPLGIYVGAGALEGGAFGVGFGAARVDRYVLPRRAGVRPDTLR